MFISSIKFSVIFLLFLLFWQISKKQKYNVWALAGATLLVFLWAGPFSLIYFLPWVFLVWLNQKIKNKTLLVLTILTGIFYIVIWKVILMYQQNHRWTNQETVFMPLGLSIFVFQGLSYLLELKKETIQPWSFLKVLAFVGFFPTISAGPIQNASFWQKKFNKINIPNRYTVSKAMSLFTLGFFYKYFLSSQLYHFDNLIFLAPFNYDTATLILGIYGFSMEIYSDFNGWSLMAQSVCLLIGIPINRNFNQPYLSTSIQKFWHRWHIALSDFFKQYIYIDLLGGSRKGKARQIINIFLTMAISGLWHGLNGGFLIWGALHALANSFNHLTKNKIHLPKWLSIFLTFHFVAFSWIFFKCQQFTLSMQYLQALSHWKGVEHLLNYWHIILLIILAFVLHFMEKKVLLRLLQIMLNLIRFNCFLTIIVSVILISLIYVLSPSGVPPFIYFNF